MVPPWDNPIAIVFVADMGIEGDGRIHDHIILDGPISAFAQFDSDAEAKVLGDIVVG